MVWGVAKKTAAYDVSAVSRALREKARNKETMAHIIKLRSTGISFQLPSYNRSSSSCLLTLVEHPTGVKGLSARGIQML